MAASELRSLPEGAIASRLKTLAETASNSELRDDTASLWRLREAAAVLIAFDPAHLRPVEDKSTFDERARLRFMADLVGNSDLQAGGGWRLSNGVRQLALQRLKGKDQKTTRARLLEALAANPERSMGRAQELLEATVKGSLPTIETMSRDELAALINIVGWFTGIISGLPDGETLTRAMGLADLIYPRQQLAGRVFVGREDELQRLADHVGVLPVEGRNLTSRFRRFSASIRELVGVQRQPLFLYGPGGVGKSTLMARFILDHAWRAAPPLPFVILDIDRPSVEPLRPLTFLVEALGQLVQQFERMREPAEQLIGAIIDQLDRQETVLLESVTLGDNFVERFASLVGPFIGNTPLLFIVDTFEEASYLGHDVENIVFGLIGELSEALPQLRVIIVGRAAPQGRDLYYVALGELPPDAAKALIVETLKSLDVRPPRDKLLTDIVAEVGGNPMVLRLAARLLAEEDVEGLREAARRQWLQRVRIEVLQARLYGRILGHIHDANVKKLAFPGLVVRRITRGVVKEVLAQACDLNLQGDDAVDELIDIMGREVALVSRQADNSLTYRSDIRRVMLQTLDETVPAKTIKAIDLRAAAYWSGQAGPAARAEELYHRLRLGQGRSTLDSRWDPATLTYLRSALGELPDASQAWLANKMGASLDIDARASAVQVDWEESAARIARRLLENGQASDALQILRERPERLEGSSLYALEARALYILERLDEALRVTEIGLKALLQGGDAPAQIDLQLLRALILERTGNLDAAEAQVVEAIRLARVANTRRPLLRAELRLLRLHRKARMDERGALQEDALHIIEQLGLQTLRSDSVLLTDAAAELGEVAPEILLLAMDQIGADILRQTSQSLLSRILIEAGGLPATDVAKFVKGDPREVAKFATNGLVHAIQREPGRGDASRLGSLVFQEASDSSVQRTTRSEERAISKLFAEANYTGKSLALIADVIEAYFKPEDLRRILRLYLSRSVERYVPPGADFRQQIFLLLDSGAREGWVPQLLEALCTVSENPNLRTDFEDILSAAG